MTRKMVQGNIGRHWTVFVVQNPDHLDQILPWCKANLGMQFRGFMDTALGWRLSNWGRWVYEDARPRTDIGYVRVFLRRPEDIMLFKLKWSR